MKINKIVEITNYGKNYGENAILIEHSPKFYYLSLSFASLSLFVIIGYIVCTYESLNEFKRNELNFNMLLFGVVMNCGYCIIIELLLLLQANISRLFVYTQMYK